MAIEWIETVGRVLVVHDAESKLSIRDATTEDLRAAGFVPKAELDRASERADARTSDISAIAEALDVHSASVVLMLEAIRSLKKAANAPNPDNGRTLTCAVCGETATGVCTHIASHVQHESDARAEVERLKAELASLQIAHDEWRRRAESKAIVQPEPSALPYGVPGEVWVSGYSTTPGMDVYRTYAESMSDITSDNTFRGEHYIHASRLAAAVERERNEIASWLSGQAAKSNGSVNAALTTAAEFIRARGK